MNDRRLIFLPLRMPLTSLVVILAIYLVVSMVSDTKEVVLYDGRGRVEVVGDLPGTSRARARYARWHKAGDFFGAFVIGKEGYFSWSNHKNTRQGAVKAAMSTCVENSAGCRLVAILVPDITPSNDQIVIARWLVPYFRDYEEFGSYKAFAIADNGGAGWSSRNRRPYDAYTGALRACERNSTEHYDQSIATPCHVIHMGR